MPFPVNNIRAACKERGITLAELERALHIGNGVIAKWETAPRTPQIGIVIQIADYLGTTVGKLLGEEKAAAPEGDGLSEKERVLIEAFRLLPEDRQDRIVQTLQAAAHIQKALDSLG